MIVGFSCNDWLSPRITRLLGAGVTVVSANDGYPVRAGMRSLKCALPPYTAPDPHPASMIAPAIAFSEMLDDQYEEAFEFRTAYWMGFSVWLPKDWEFDNWNEGGDAVLEFQGVPDPAETKRPTNLCWMIYHDHWVIRVRWDARPTSPPDGSGYQGETDVYTQPLGISLGAWTDWVLQVRFAWDTDGLTRIWRQGALVVDREGPNCANDEIGPHMFAGIYKWAWRDGPTDISGGRTIHIDELRIANADARYGAVAPGGRF